MVWKSSFRQNYWNFLTHTVPPFAVRISHIVTGVEAPGGGRGNVCTTSMASATGPKDKEEYYSKVTYCVGLINFFFGNSHMVQIKINLELLNVIDNCRTLQMQ